MSQASAPAWTPARSAAGDHSPWLVIFVISIATFMEVLDVSVANVALDHIGGSLSASYDETTWVLTSYLISNAIVIPISGWLADVIGRKRYYMASVALFAISSLLCGLAPNLTFLILARILQGIGGGGLAPSEQSMMADTFPPEKRGMAFAAYGIVVIAGPIAGPSLGGWITDNLSWHWVFLINVPIGILSLVLVGLLVAEPKALTEEREAKLAGGLKVDWVGFLLVAAGLGFLEITLDRGQRDDWFSSPWISFCAVASAASIVALVPWELTRKEPIVDLRILFQRNFAVAFVLLMVTGVVVFGTTQFIPQLLQQVLGYTATDAGMALTVGGLATVVVMPLGGFLSGKVDPRILLGLGLLIQVFAVWNMSHLDAQISFWDASQARLFSAVGLPFLFVTVTSLAYVGLKPEQNNQASGLMNVARNLGGTIGISLVQTLLAQRQQFHQARLTETLNGFNPVYTQSLNHAAAVLRAQGQPAATAQAAATAHLYQALTKQADMLSFVDAFHALMLVILLMIPLIFLMKGRPVGAPAGGAH
ncbi:MAG TPA: DHA2 family efflux MFS transporter permease subunit [Caulobacteraceae bacterium]|nr:DHA2 family efflux MFS transporter permease subunit [Caulobacteraceae bacterium]